MKKAIIINGFGGSGKNTFVEMCKKVAPECKNNYIIENISSVDIIKKVAKILGWDGVSKTEKDRRFLYELKKLATEYNDSCLKYMVDVYNDEESSSENKIIFFHIREPKEIERAEDALDAETLYIKNNRVMRNENNLEDTDIENILYDYVIDNSGSLEELEAAARNFINMMI